MLLNIAKLYQTDTVDVALTVWFILFGVQSVLVSGAAKLDPFTLTPIFIALLVQDQPDQDIMLYTFDEENTLSISKFVTSSAALYNKRLQPLAIVTLVALATPKVGVMRVGEVWSTVKPDQVTHPVPTTVAKDATLA